MLSDKYINDTEEAFRIWITSNMMFYYDTHDIHQKMLECVDDEHLEGSGFVFQNITEVIFGFLRIRDISASSYIELLKKYKN